MFEGGRQSFVKSFQMTLIKALQRCSLHCGRVLQHSLILKVGEGWVGSYRVFETGTAGESVFPNKRCNPAPN